MWRFATLSKFGRLSMVVQQKVERQRSEKPGISSNYISPLTIRDNPPGESFFLGKCVQQKVFRLLSMMMIISLFLEKTPPYYAPSPSPPKLSSYQSRPLQAPLLSTLLPPLQTTPFSESTLSIQHCCQAPLISRRIRIKMGTFGCHKFELQAV